MTRFVDARIAQGLGKPEYRRDDLGKPEWLTVFEDLATRFTADQISVAIGAMETAVKNPAQFKVPEDLGRSLRGPRAAEAFAGHIGKLILTSGPGLPNRLGLP